MQEVQNHSNLKSVRDLYGAIKVSEMADAFHYLFKDWDEGTFKLVKGLIKGTYNSLTWPNLEMSLIVSKQIVTFSSIFDLNYYSHQTILVES